MSDETPVVETPVEDPAATVEIPSEPAPVEEPTVIEEIVDAVEDGFEFVEEHFILAGKFLSGMIDKTVKATEEDWNAVKAIFNKYL